MNQTGIIFACLFAAWLMFITARGELPAYISVLTGSDPAQQANGGSGSGSSGSTAKDAQTTMQVAEIAAMFA